MAGRILVVDPLAGARSDLARFLASKGHAVETADGPVSARRAALRFQPRTAIVVEPARDGTGVPLAARLARDPALQRCGVIALAPAADTTARIACLQAGVLDVIGQTLDRRFLSARLRAFDRSRTVAEELALQDETTEALGLSEPRSGGPTPPGRIEFHVAAGGDGGADLIARLQPLLPDRLSCAGDREEKPDVAVLILRDADDLDHLAELRATLPQARLLALVGVPQGDVAARALDLGADDVAGLGDAPAEIALRLRALVRRAQDHARCRARITDGLLSAHKDALTGLWNRRYAEPHLARLADAAVRDGRPMAVLLLDLDHFKAVNDRRGHPAGDAVLREVAARLSASLRIADLLARVGGEEFLIALPDAGPEEALSVAERLCAAIAGAPVAVPGGPPIPVTASVGMAYLPPAARPAPPAAGSAVFAGGRPGAKVGAARRLVAEADRALYRSKAEGRARVTVAA